MQVLCINYLLFKKKEGKKKLLKYPYLYFTEQALNSILDRISEDSEEVEAEGGKKTSILFQQKVLSKIFKTMIVKSSLYI